MSDHEKMIPVPQFEVTFGFPVGGILGWVRGYAMKVSLEGALSLKFYRFDVISTKKKSLRAVTEGRRRSHPFFPPHLFQRSKRCPIPISCGLGKRCCAVYCGM